MSIRNQDYENIEIIVVDNHSQDRTRQVARKLADVVYDFQEEQKLTGVRNFRGAQLNFGVSKSRGDIIFFPDADMALGKGLLSEAEKLFSQYDALYIPEIVMGDGLLQALRNFERSFYNQTPIDAVRFVKRSFYDNIGGFDEAEIKFGFDDWDFTKKLKIEKAKLAICRVPIYHNEDRITLLNLLRKKKRYTTDYLFYLNKWGREDSDIRHQFGMYYRMLGVFIEGGKWKKFLRNPHYALGVLALKTLVAATFVYERLKGQIISDYLKTPV